MPRKARRGRGEGSIYQRASDGLWVAVESRGYRADGKRDRLVRYGRTKKEAQDSIEKARGEGAIKDASGLSLRAYIQRWLADSVSQQVSQASCDAYRKVLDQYVSPTIGYVLLAKLTTMHVQQVYSAMAKKGLSGTTRKQAHVILKMALKQAVRWKLIESNPADGVAVPRKVSPKLTVLQDESQVKAFLSAAKDERYYALLVMALHTGARLGELLALTWKDIDLPRAKVSITKSVAWNPTRVVPTKTKAGVRTLNIIPATVTALVEHRKRLLTEGLAGSPLVFPSVTGKYAQFDTSVLMRRVAEAADLPVMRFHDLRHTHLTLLLKNGVHPKVVQERAGHANVRVTLDTYSHVLPSMQTDVVDRLGKMLG